MNLRPIFRAILFSLYFLLTACTTSPRYVNLMHNDLNARSQNRATVETYLSTTCIDSSQNVSSGCAVKKEETFIGVAISGGGSRAANYSAAVLRELDSIGILQHVDAISSVSGGSLAAAYLAAKGQRFKQNTSEFWKNAKRDLSQDFRSKLLMKLARPNNFISSMFGSLGRTELMAQVFDETLFNGTTFGSMGDYGYGLLINATALNDFPTINSQACAYRVPNNFGVKWASIGFTDHFFRYCLGSDLNSYPLSHAVAASAAFPALFSAMPLAGYPTEVELWYDAKRTPRRFLHVMDGGASDNLGVDSLMGSLFYNRNNFTGTAPKKCLLIVIDAFASGEIDDKHKSNDIRSPLDRIVDTNFFDSINAMLSHRRKTTLHSLGFRGTREDSPNSLENFPVPGVGFERGRHETISTTNLRRILGLRDNPHNFPFREREDVECRVWYLSIDALEEHIDAHWEFGKLREEKTLAESQLKYTYEDLEVSLSKYLTSDYPRRVAAISDLANRVKTDFNLVGPKNCSRRTLADALWAAGALSINADVLGRKDVCGWVKERGFVVSADCDSEDLHELPQLPVKYNPTGDGDYSISCE